MGNFDRRTAGKVGTVSNFALGFLYLELPSSFMRSFFTAAQEIFFQRFLRGNVV